MNTGQVLKKNDDGTYDLDCKPQVPKERLRKAQARKGSKVVEQKGFKSGVQGASALIAIAEKVRKKNKEVHGGLDRTIVQINLLDS